MENDRRSRISGIINNIFEFISHVFGDCIEGRYSEDNTYEQFSLPANAKDILRMYVLGMTSDDLIDDFEILSKTDANLELLKNVLSINIGEGNSETEDSRFINWITMCCLAKKMYLEQGLIEAPGTIMALIIEKCEQSGRHSAFRSLGYDV